MWSALVNAQAVTFSVITATYDAALELPRLIRSLQAQEDRDFEWVVMDGASTDGTLELLADAAGTLNVRVDSRPDFGIYDALNRGVKMATGDYYLVVGADDELFPNAIRDYRAACTASGADLLTANIEARGIVRGPHRYRWEWLYGPFAYVSGHAVGLAIRRDLHEQYGLYSKQLPIAADQLFLLRAIHGGATVIYKDTFVAGVFSLTGVSGSQAFGTQLESLRVQIMMGHNPLLQLALFALKVVCRYRRYFPGGS